MNTTKYQKLFGIGPLSLVINLLLFAVMCLFDRKLGHVAILERPAPLVVAGILLICLWICWHSWCVVTIRRWWIDSQLCTTGPYRYVRHPMYAGGLVLAFLGVSLMFNSWIILISPLLQYVVLSLLVRKEETMMMAVFGEEYIQYADRTGRLLPKIFR